MRGRELGRRVLGRGTLVLVLAAAAACAPPEEVISRELLELERLAFVLPGRCRLDGYAAPFDEFVVEGPLLVDLFEATRGDWDHYFGESVDGARDAWPVSLTFAEAEALAERRGMRLPTPSEWIYCAVGPRSHPFPWGVSAQSSVANTLDLGLGRPSAVGTFENGRGHFGQYDLHGNVWEWVDGAVPGRDGFLLREGEVSVMGGSWLYRAGPTYAPSVGSSRATFHSLTLDRRTRSVDIGARFATDARDYLRARAGSWGDGPLARARIEAVGRRFGVEAGALLEELAAEPGAPESLSWLAKGATDA